MKVIFLDIDGVLNSVAYDRERTSAQGNIDETRLPLLRRLVEATGARIVLSTSWRRHWDRDPERRDWIGRELSETFSLGGLEIFDKTPEIDPRERPSEVRAWLLAHPEVESYVILDDFFGGWEELSNHLVKTHPRVGRGLEDAHVSAAIRILKGEKDGT